MTSLGRAVADALAISHHDTDDYLWQPTTPPYREIRAAADRLRLMREVFLDRADWVLSGSLAGWGDPLIPLFNLVVYLHAPTAVRVRRLLAREAKHFGADAIAVGGWRHQETERFIEWASHYDDGGASRNSALHQAWLAALPCSVLRLDGTRPLADLVKDVCAII